MRDRIQAALKRSSAEYTEIRIEREERTLIAYEGEALRGVELSAEFGGNVRVLADGGWGSASFNTFDQLDGALTDALAIARLIGTRRADHITLAPVAPIEDEVRPQLADDPRTHTLAEKQALLAAYNDCMLKHDPRIVSTFSEYTDSLKEIVFAASTGTYIVEERPDITLLLVAIARADNGEIQQALEMDGYAAGYEAVRDRIEFAQSAAQRAIDLLSARPVQSGAYTVVLDQELAGIFIHEAFGHLCEADFLYKNERLRATLELGRAFGPPSLTVFDAGDMPGLRGNARYDDEGVPRQTTTLVRDGVLTGFMHNRETAARMGVASTGNARAVSYSYDPIVRMRHTYIAPGPHTFADMLAGVDHGLYACHSWGGQTALEQFTFSSGYGYEIVNGQLGELVRGTNLLGNVFETLKSIDRIGQDPRMLGGARGCGKDGQMQLPLTSGAPHLRIQNLTVGGTA